MVRAARSTLLLISVGDDVHGAGVFRGVLEILFKLSYVEAFKDEYVLFKEFNACLQSIWPIIRGKCLRSGCIIIIFLLHSRASSFPPSPHEEVSVFSNGC